MQDSSAKNTISAAQPVKQALEMLNSLKGDLTLFILDDKKKVVGSLTDGDIRRGLMKGYDIQNSVIEFANKNFYSLVHKNFTIDDIERIKELRINLVPVVDEEYRLKKIIDFSVVRSILPAEALIMAGGEGKRLRPLTEKMPKPMLRIGEKPIIQYNIDRLLLYGVNRIHISIKYLGNHIVEYFEKLPQYNGVLNFIEESEPLGTIGAISLIDDIAEESIIVMNSDILTNIDFEDFYKDYKASEAKLAIASTSYKIKVPYAVLETEHGMVKSFREKPSYTYYSNAGIYILKRECLKYIPSNTFFDATDLISALLSDNKKIISYPILDYWMDIGRLEDYKKAQNDIKHIKL